MKLWLGLGGKDEFGVFLNISTNEFSLSAEVITFKGVSIQQVTVTDLIINVRT